MSNSSKPRYARTLTALMIASAMGAGFAMAANPAMALCKYGTPHCVNPNPGPKPPVVGGVQIPPSGWVDPDCKYYGNCYSANSALRAGSGGIASGGKVLVK
jgi:hypothetical protein